MGKIDRTPFTEARVKAFPLMNPATDKYPVIHLDEKKPGFMVICYRDFKAYYVQADRPDPDGRRGFKTTRLKIDRTDTISLKDAWETADAWLADLRKGVHPKEKEHEDAKVTAIERERKTFTLRDAVRLHLDESPKIRSEKTVHEYRKIFDTHLRDWMDRPLIDIGADKPGLVALHSEITKHGWDTESREGRGRKKRKGAPYSANGMVRALRAAYQWARKEKPELGLPEFPYVHLNTEEASDKHVPLAELPQWFEAVMDLRDQHKVLNTIRRDAHLFAMFSGLRAHDALSAEWANVNWEDRCLFIPRPKGGKRRAFWYPLSDFLIGLLECRKADASTHAAFQDSPWIFPAVSGPCKTCNKPGHVPDLDQEYHDYLKQYGAKDYRHSFGSYAAASGLQLYQVKFLLNHKQEATNVTFRYAKALLEAALDVSERIRRP